jgi:hypothetical protein
VASSKTCASASAPYTPEFVDALVELVRSPNETTRLAAIREAFDRLLGKPPVAVDTNVAKFDIGALYLQAVQAANRPNSEAAIYVTPADELAVRVNGTPDQW